MKTTHFQRATNIQNSGIYTDGTNDTPVSQLG